METQEPKTLQEAIRFFADPDRCREYLVARRWPDGVSCPRCGSKNVRFQPKHNRWQCGTHHARRQFTLKTETIFEGSPIGLDKWLCAMWLIVSCKNGVSSYEVHRALGVTQKTAWFMLQRIRLAIQDDGPQRKLVGIVEADETFIGAKARNMHKGKREKTVKGRGGLGSGKTPVMALLERSPAKGGSKVRAKVIDDTRKRTLQRIIRDHIEPGSAVCTDQLASYEGLEPDFLHGFVNHAERYVDGIIHTNGCENFWTLLKRTIKGTYVSVEPFHLFRYLDEQSFRFNNREAETDGERLSRAVRQVTGKRLTYSELTGKTNSGEFLN